MKRIILAYAFLILGIAGASAACSPPAVMKDNASTTFNMSLATANDGNCKSVVDADPNGTLMTAVNAGVATPASAAPANVIMFGALQNGGTTAVALVGDPCQTAAKISTPISQATSTKLFFGNATKKNYICSIVAVGSDAENLSFVEGTGANCSGSTAAIIGATTAASGVNLSANAGFALGGGGSFIASGFTVNLDVCLIQSGTGRVAGVMTYVQQ